MPIKKLEIKKLHKSAVIPEAATTGSVGYDLTATSMEVDPVQRCWIYGTGLAMAAPKGYFIDVRPRSSIYKQGPFVLANSCGVVDPDYQGEIKFVFRCTDSDWDLLSDPPYEIGDRCGQMLLLPVNQIEFEEVKDFVQKTARGTGGYGSTGGRKKK